MSLETLATELDAAHQDCTNKAEAAFLLSIEAEAAEIAHKTDRNNVIEANADDPKKLGSNEAQRQIKIDELTTTTKKARELAQNQLSKARFDLDMASRHLNRTRDRMFILAIEKGISLG